MATKEEPKC